MAGLDGARRWSICLGIVATAWALADTWLGNGEFAKGAWFVVILVAIGFATSTLLRRRFSRGTAQIEVAWPASPAESRAAAIAALRDLAGVDPLVEEDPAEWCAWVTTASSHRSFGSERRVRIAGSTNVLALSVRSVRPQFGGARMDQQLLDRLRALLISSSAQG